MTPSSPASARLGIGDLKHKPTHSRPPAARFGSVWIPRSADSQPAAENAADRIHARKRGGAPAGASWMSSSWSISRALGATFDSERLDETCQCSIITCKLQQQKENDLLDGFFSNIVWYSGSSSVIGSATVYFFWFLPASEQVQFNGALKSDQSHRDGSEHLFGLPFRGAKSIRDKSRPNRRRIDAVLINSTLSAFSLLLLCEGRISNL